MSKFYDIIEEECNFNYHLYTTEPAGNERKNSIAMYFMVSFQLKERTKGKNEFEIIMEYLKLRNELEEELEYRIKHSGENSDGVKNTRYKLQELDLIAHFFARDWSSDTGVQLPPAIIQCFT